MADLIRPQFQKESEKAIASYDWVDIAEGTGMVKFYGYQSRIAANPFAYNLTTNTPYTASGSIQVHANGTGEFDFDLSPFRLPQTINGTAFIETGFYIGGSSSGAVEVWLKHYDGTTETTLDSALSPPLTTGVDQNEGINYVIPLTIPLTHFKAGDTLRLTMKMYCAGGAGLLGTDPKNQEWADWAVGTEVTTKVPTSQLILNVPFRLDL